MIVYYVNRNTKYRGPYDIIDSNRQHIIKVGDVCLRDTKDGVCFLLVTNSDNSWNACKQVGIGSNSELSELGNTLLFSFDGLHKRNGNIPLIVQLSFCFREKVIVDFFCNAKDILKYKTDFWDASLFMQFFASTQVLLDRNTDRRTITQHISKKYPTYFAKYFDNDLLRVLNENLAQGKSIKEAYVSIRNKYPSDFRNAMMTFLLENPGHTIYDKTVITIESEKTEPEPAPIEIQREIVIDEYDSFRLTNEKKQELKRLFNRYHKGDSKAFDKIVQDNQKLVAVIANSYKGHGVDYEDLLQEGTIGLIKAVERYNPNREVAFPFYAKWWIHRYLIDALQNLMSMVRIPPQHMALYRKVRKSIERYEQEHGYEPSPSEIDIGEDIDPENLAFLSNLPDDLQELTTLSNDLDELPGSGSTDDLLMKESQLHFINSILNRLKKREAYILRCLYGIGEKSESLSIIGDRLGLTRERVRQIKEKTVRHLRDILKNRKWIVDNEFTVQHEEEEQKEVKPIVDLEHKKKIKRKKEGNKKKPIPGILHVPYARQEKTIEKVRTEEVPDTQYEVNEKDGLKVGDSIYYDYQYCTIRNIIENGKFTKLIIEYINGVRDAVIYKKTKVITKRTSPKSHQNYHHKEFENSKCMMIKEAMVGDRIIYDADHCTVIDKKTIKGSLRLIVRYEDGTIDNLRNDWNSYKIVSRNNEDVISTKMDNESSISEIAVNEEREVEEDDIDIPSVEPYREIKVPLQETKDDELEEGSIDIIKFKTIFDNKSTSYKFFWFMSIISLAKEKDCLRITYKDIVIRMAAMAWPIVFEYEIDLGKVDMISKYLNDILKNTTLKKFVSSKLVEDYLSTFYRSEGIDSILKPLLKNVPYRFLSPWIKYTTDEEVIEKSNSDDCACLYALRKNGIVLNEKWWEYIRERYSKICEYTEGSFIMYVQPNNKNKNLTRFISKGWSLV